MSPWSSSVVTRCTVAPANLQPMSMARWWVFRPVKAGSRLGGVVVDEWAFVGLNEAGREDAHEAGQPHRRRIVVVDFGHERNIEGFARREGLVIEHGGGYLVFAW